MKTITFKMMLKLQLVRIFISFKLQEINMTSIDR